MPSSSDNMISMQPPHSPSIDQSTLQQSCSIDAEQHQPSRNPASVPSTNTSPPRQPQYMLHANSNSVPQQQSYHVWNLNQTSIPYFLLALYNKRTSTMLITQQHTQSVCSDPTTQQQAHSASYDPTGTAQQQSQFSSGTPTTQQPQQCYYGQTYQQPPGSPLHMVTIHNSKSIHIEVSQTTTSDNVHHTSQSTIASMTIDDYFKHQ